MHITHANLALQLLSQVISIKRAVATGSFFLIPTFSFREGSFIEPHHIPLETYNMANDSKIRFIPERTFHFTEIRDKTNTIRTGGRLER
jgi:hypothetical protein